MPNEHLALNHKKSFSYLGMTVNHLIFFAEFQKIALATAIGFAIMGFIGFFVKLIHIPINNIIVQWHLFTVSSFPVLPSN